MKVSSEQTITMSKHGIDIAVYPLDRPDVDVCRVTTDEGHFQEFMHTSTFTYYIIEGEGTFYLDGEATPAKTGDVIMAPPGTKIYYIGSFDMILVTTPAWTEKGETHVRFIDRPNS